MRHPPIGLDAPVDG